MTDRRPSTLAASALALGLGVVALYVALVVWLTWPLARQASTHLAHTMPTCRIDVPLVTWALAHETRALVSHPWSFGSANIYHPTPHALFYGEAAFGALPLFAPVFLATDNPVLAINVVFLAGVALTAAAIHGAARHWSGSHLAGLVAGTTFLATPWVLWAWVPSAPNYAVLPYIPLVMVVAARGVSRWRPALRLGALVALQGLTSVYVAAAMVAPLTVLAVARTFRRPTREGGLHLVLALGFALALLVLAFSGYVLVRLDNPEIARQSPYVGIPFLATDDLPRVLFRTNRPTAIPFVALSVIFIGALCRMFAPPGHGAMPSRTAWRHCLLWIAVGTYVSLVPSVTVAGQSIPLPRLPDRVYETLRAPGRLGIAALIGASVLSGVAFAELAGRLSRRMPRGGTSLLAVSVVALMYLVYVQPITPMFLPVDPAKPYPTIVAQPPTGAVFSALLQSRGPLLELPIGPGTFPHAAAMMSSIYHQHPLLNGYNGYWPEAFPHRMELACRLPDPDALAELVRTTGVELILVHGLSLEVARTTPRQSLPYGCLLDTRRDDAARGTLREWLAASQNGARSNLRLIAQEGADLLFRVESATDSHR